jgi:uncharacterized membrane protein
MPAYKKIKLERIKKSPKKDGFTKKVKNFFKLPNEVFEEEPSKNFEKIPLIKLGRNKIFLFITLFLILINILVGFGINFLYLRQILGFLFLILVPGLLLMLCFKVRTVKFWEFLVYTVGLSIAFIMFAGLAINLALPALNITDKPLSLGPILINFNLFLIILGAVAYKRNADFQPVQITVPKLDALNNIFFIIPLIFPVLSILGSFILNNHGPNTLTLIMLLGITVYVISVILFRKRLNPNIWPWIILLISVSLLLMCSLRSWYVSGWDISQEEYVFRLAQENQIWSMKFFQDSYNSCLSLSILPTVLNLFVDINSQFIFKLLFPLIFIFHSLTVFLIFRRYAPNVFSFIASFLYFGSGYYNLGFSALIRQEIGFLFFGLMLLILFSKEIYSKTKKKIFLIFSLSIIVSHYSTAYIFIIITTLTYFISCLYKKKIEKEKVKEEFSKKRDINFNLTFILLLILSFSCFMWLTQLTDTSGGLVSTITKTVQNMGSAFSSDLKQSSIKDALLSQSKTGYYTDGEFTDYINKVKTDYPKWVDSGQLAKNYPLNVLSVEVISPKSVVLGYFFSYLFKFIKYLIIFSILIGSLLFFVNKDKFGDIEFSFMVIISVFLMFMMILLPFISKAYNFERLFQQCLIFLALPSVLFFQKIRKKFVKLPLVLIILIYLLYSLFNFGVLLPYSGGAPTINLYNGGEFYNFHYSYLGEVSSISWTNSHLTKEMVYLDPYSKLKFYSFATLPSSFNQKVIPFLIEDNSYIYSSYANKIKGINSIDDRINLNAGILFFNFPTSFLETDKDKIYNNGESELFK